MKTLFGNKHWALVLVIGILAFNLTAGCAERSVRTETTTAPGASTVVVEKETRVEDDHHGPIGGVFHIVGEVLAFPFQLVADVFRFIF